MLGPYWRVLIEWRNKDRENMGKSWVLVELRNMDRENMGKSWVLTEVHKTHQNNLFVKCTS
jgi:hypothetical protein